MTVIKHRPNRADKQAAAGAAIYSRPVLMIYDLFVLGFSNTFAWKCSSRKILEFYNQHISGNHLDVGVGTGYFLDKCSFPASAPRIALLDLNANSLAVTAKRLRRYCPETRLADVLESLPAETREFDSVGLGYLLHCLPGSMAEKAAVFRNVKPLLSRNGIVFGTTILGRGVRRNYAARALMNIYNAKGVFSNRNDNRNNLEQVLKENFSSFSIRVEGCVAFFTGRV